MKQFIIAAAILLFGVFVQIYNEDNNTYNRYNQVLKFVAEEAAAAAAQYYSKEDYGEGMIVFDQTEGVKAAEYVIKKNLYLDDSFMPIPNNYFKEKVNYTIEFFDHSSSSFPFLYTHDVIFFTEAIGDPTVVVTIDAGLARHRTLDTTDIPVLIRAASHEWKAPENN